jgi:predicted metal-dependent HD superfamily phosphohydrolase
MMAAAAARASSDTIKATITAAFTAAVSSLLNKGGDLSAVVLPHCDGGELEAAAILSDILARHEEPHRAYHTLAHLHSMLQVLCAAYGCGGVGGVASLPPHTIMAVLFHDCVYNTTVMPGAVSNEQQSAQVAAAQLNRLGVAPADVEEVCVFIRATEAHCPPAGREQDAHLAAFLDADLAVLAATDSDSYAAYRDGVRSEYSHVTDEQWRVGRGAVLRRLLARPALYLGAYAAAQGWEATARANLAAELAGLGFDVPP